MKRQSLKSRQIQWILLPQNYLTKERREREDLDHRRSIQKDDD